MAHRGVGNQPLEILLDKRRQRAIDDAEGTEGKQAFIEKRDPDFSKFPRRP